jgi:hypothetical protein
MVKKKKTRRRFTEEFKAETVKLVKLSDRKAAPEPERTGPTSPWGILHVRDSRHCTASHVRRRMVSRYSATEDRIGYRNAKAQ